MTFPPSLADSVQYLKGIGPARAACLARVGVTGIRDLLYHLPRQYLDRGRIRPIRGARPGELVLLQGTLTRISEQRRRGGSMLTATLSDASGRIELVWFHAPPFLRKQLGEGVRLIATGTVALRRGLQIAHPEIELLDDGGTGEIPPGILPCYPLTEGLSQRVLRGALPAAVARYAPLLPEFLPEALRTARNLLPRAEALRAVHAPARAEEAREGRRRLAYDELFLLQLVLALRRQGERQVPGTPIPVDDRLHARILKRLPFTPTAAQARAFSEIRKDLASGRPMNRLLQGDVGSGKTAVAVYAMLAAVANKAQAALLAPTEILAEQHAHTLARWLKGSRVRWALLVGGMPKRERAGILERLGTGALDLVVGTHALIDGSVAFANLALAVVDEQHRFGVLQRAALAAKGPPPHLLAMTATPIPRTLMFTVFGDLDVTLLDEIPPGRQPIETRVVPEDRRLEAYDLIRRDLDRGRQAFFVAPLIEESETLRAKSALRLLDEVRAAFPSRRILFLHGRLPTEGKQQVMAEFQANRAAILVSTQVVEVGVDVPNASVMVIESAERYGLAQLHQLRGRIGRGAHASRCLLFSRGEPEGLARLEVLAGTQDGFRIAEEDLRLRGPGEFLGTRQHGMPELKVASLLTDLPLLLEAREDAFALVAGDPGLAGPGNALLRDAIREHFGKEQPDWTGSRSCATH